jgi:hypothetical protein
LPAWFTAWIARRSSRTLDLRMISTAHFMHDVYGPFDARLSIEPPMGPQGRKKRLAPPDRSRRGPSRLGSAGFLRRRPRRAPRRQLLRHPMLLTQASANRLEDTCPRRDPPGPACPRGPGTRSGARAESMVPAG